MNAPEDPSTPPVSSPPAAAGSGRVPQSMGPGARRAVWWGAAAMAASVAAVGLAYLSLHAEMNTQYAATREELQGIHTELRQIRQVLAAESESEDTDEDAPVPAPNTVRIDIGGYPSQGNPKASLVMVEFTDFQCPYCARYHAATYPQLKKAYIDTQRMRYVVVDYPLEFHELAFKAAEAAHCGAKQGRYWEVHDRLFKSTPNLQPANLPKLVEGLGLDIASFQSCLDKSATAEEVKRGIAQGEVMGVDGTPTFVIGRAEGSVVRGRMIVGAYPVKVFTDVIQSHLALK
jgi:protein-disulfide isomerase